MWVAWIEHRSTSAFVRAPSSSVAARAPAAQRRSLACGGNKDAQADEQPASACVCVCVCILRKSRVKCLCRVSSLLVIVGSTMPREHVPTAGTLGRARAQTAESKRLWAL
mmetsp:Transcript_6666/g.20275  ORF Transcript_6666/g.20275 Transcript_6666/m.20275 type:complete len:110 (+) Transcript_6666:398-727(+)